MIGCSREQPAPKATKPAETKAPVSLPSATEVRMAYEAKIKEADALARTTTAVVAFALISCTRPAKLARCEANVTLNANGETNSGAQRIALDQKQGVWQMVGMPGEDVLETGAK